MAKGKSVAVTYTKNAVATCLNCKSTYTLGLTDESLSLEICAHCHPFYTGQETLLDTAGRIEKFNARLSQASGSKKSSVKKKVRKLKAGLGDTFSAQTEEIKE